MAYKTDSEATSNPSTTKEQLDKDFVSTVRTALSDLRGEIDERNTKIAERDDFVYGDRLERSLDIPVGHDFTPVNWLRRSVEIHKVQFMGRPFQIISTSDTKDTNIEDQDEAARIKVENKKQKAYAELRQNIIDDIIEDNGGHSLFMTGAESASAIGDFIIKAWYDEDESKYVLSPIEAVENCYVLWNKDDYRTFDAFAYASQISKQSAIKDYGVPSTVATSVLGSPLDYVGSTGSNITTSTQPMVTIMEVTGKIPGWASDKGKLKRVDQGKETSINTIIVGDCVYRVIDEEKKMPRHYILPNKKQRRRPWGEPDISDAAIQINLTYVETLSDWRTVSSKVNFPKFKAFNFGQDAQLPKYQARSVQILPLGENQDISFLSQGDSNQIDFKAQMDELKEQFVRETGISRVLFDDPSITLNSNQALLTSMKPTSDIAETKKQLWGPILVEMFEDALEVLAEWDEDVKQLVDEDFTLKIMWPSVMQKEDPIYQQMLLNRKNAGTISMQSYLEAQGETKEEIDRIRDEMSDPVTAAMLGNQLPLLATNLIAPPQPKKEDPKVSVSLRGDLTPMQEAEIAAQNGFNSQGEVGPQGQAGLNAYSNADNAGFINGNAFNGGTANTQTLNSTTPSPNAASQPPQIATPANNTEGSGVVSQPGSGATPVSPEGAVNQVNQNNGA